MRAYRPLGEFVKQTEELRKLICEHPDYPIIVMVNCDVVCDDMYAWWYAPDLRFEIGEILDCDQEVNDERVYTDRDDFREDIQYALECDESHDNDTDEEFDEAVKKIMDEYEPYWKDVIMIRADV